MSKSMNLTPDNLIQSYKKTYNIDFAGFESEVSFTESV